MKKVLLVLLALVVLFLLYVGIAYGPVLKRLFTYSIEELDENMTILWGYGGNSVVLRSDDGSKVLIVDTKMGGGAKRLKEVVSAMAPDAEITVVNTHVHADHVGGNKQFVGARIIAGLAEADEWMEETRMDRPPDVALAAGEDRVVAIGDESVHIRNVGRGHS